MLSLIENLPVEIVGTHVLGYLTIRDIVMLERGCGSKKSHQQFLSWFPYSSPVVFPESNLKSVITFNWFVKRQCRISALIIRLPGDNPCLQVENLQVDNFDLQIHSNTAIEELIKPLLEKNLGYKVKTIYVDGNQNREDMEQLSACISNVKQLHIQYSCNCMEWLTSDILSKWKLNKIDLFQSEITGALVSLIVQTCSELTSIKLYSNNIDDSAVIAIAQHCPKLETLLLRSSIINITYLSLLALSERCLPLEKLDILRIPNISNVDVARRCSHALSRIRYLDTTNRNVSVLIPYMTGLTSIVLSSNCDTYLPLLIQYCHKLSAIVVNSEDLPVTDVLSLSRANPLLQELRYYVCGITDTALIELVHACPHLHTFYLPHETDITDISILALSEHCPQLRQLTLYNCDKVTEAAVLQLLQRCHKLTRLEILSSSLLEETWTQLDKNTQRRVSRC